MVSATTRQNGISYKRISGSLKSNETYTTALAGSANASVGAILQAPNRGVLSAAPTVSFLAGTTSVAITNPSLTFDMLATGGGTLPVVGDVINIVVG